MKVGILCLTTALVMVLAISLAMATPVMAQPSQVWVDDDNCPGPGDGSPGNPFCKIQDGVNAVAPGGTVYVAAGTYRESVTITNSLTLRGAKANVDARGRSIPTDPPTDPSESTVISSINTIVAASSATTVTINGFSIIGYRAAVDMQSAQSSLIYNVISPSSAGAGTPPALVYIHGSTVATATALYNDISPTATGSWPSGANALRIANTNGALITVSNNRLHNASHHPSALGAGLALPTNVNAIVSVTNNDLYDNGSDGMWTYNFTGTLTVTGNDIYDNGETGVKIWTGVTGMVNINNNNIFGNTDYGVRQANTFIVDATNNWWGDASGPLDVTAIPDACGLILDNPSGLGNEVSDCVNYSSWQGQGGGGGGCFIATAAYGSYLDSHVETLRDFRDQYLLTNPIGSALVSTYYEVSPPMARFIDDHPNLKPIVRVGLLPAVAMSTVAVNTTSAEKVAIVGSLLLISALTIVWLRRKGVLSRF